ncbi:hypothetical protein SEPCBS57363_002884 [Sporothrix epigloea]|uniref:Mucin n=1 Tax=Sporothrix epigloea TaxID=1892477 RepID=A0ABP0DIJ7_9PEZI
MDVIGSNDTRPSLGQRNILGFEQQQQASTSSAATERPDGITKSFYDSFRWLEEEDSLDLRLFMDDCHSDLRDALPAPSKERRPKEGRRHSVSKLPRTRPLPTALTPIGLPSGNSSVSDSRPAPTDIDTSARTVALPSINGSGGGKGVIPFPTILASSSTEHPSTTYGSGGHLRRKSRTLSLITPKQHAARDSVSTIDPGAAHYQDPEARMKLRLYLASPEKFDEAIKLGFPSTEMFSATSSSGPADTPLLGSLANLSPNLHINKRNSTTAVDAKKRHQGHGTRQMSILENSGMLRTFLVDDDEDEDGVDAKSDDDEMAKLDSDQASMPDPDSPKTPSLTYAVSSIDRKASTSSAAFRPCRISSSNDALHSPQLLSGLGSSDSYASSQGTSREMTLRMTLTRLDLRAAEEQIYGWQQQPQYQPKQVQQHHNHSHSTSGNNQSYPDKHQNQQQQHQSVSYSDGRKHSVSTAGVARPFNPPPRVDRLVLPSSVTAAPAPTIPTPTSTCDSTITYLGAGTVSRPKESIEDVFAGIDHWEADQDKGVIKRFWHRVRRS